jgi:formimidoylglutamate deiminase
VSAVRVAAMPNAHSHAWHRLLRGAGERGGDFWTWREAMYRVGSSLEPESLHEAALGAYREMTAAGYGAVGEFHYLHHRPDGRPYDEPNAMAIAVADAAVAAGLEITLLATAYARAGWRDGADIPPEPAQRRFVDESAAAFLERVEALAEWATGRPGVRVGVAVHSVRALPASWIEQIAARARDRGWVLHVHACEQVREVEECRAEHGLTPIELLDRCGALGPRTSVIHAVHVTDADIALLAAAGSIVVACPTTEGNLGDGHLRALALHRAGVRLAIGSDSQVRVDPFEEARELETGARREGRTRAALLAATDGRLWDVLVENGRASLGLDGPMPQIAVDVGHPTLAHVPPEDLPAALVTCATAAVVRTA